ncbi:MULTISPECIES: type VI immunity family protein [unclassified Paraburkholderia]|uniref:type VI immunity family protein n=1 Tax=unclassified Paraburkholderia TaxID=2615204 RepID=UPI002AAFB946|nr:MULTISPECIES: type VI immunity family protein [unclassified Paraburkholderia]
MASTPPPAYVPLNAALRPIVASTVRSLLDGTVNGTKPLLSTTVTSEAWLRRFPVEPNKLNPCWIRLY